MARVPYERERRLDGPAEAGCSCWPDRRTARPDLWAGNRDTAAQLLSTIRRQRFAQLNRYADRCADAPLRRRVSPHDVPAALGPQVRQFTVVEVSSGLALGLGVVLTAASALVMATACGLGLLGWW